MLQEPCQRSIFAKGVAVDYREFTPSLERFGQVIGQLRAVSKKAARSVSKS
jgi:hypothetical protein